MSFTAAFTVSVPATGELTVTDTSNYGGAEPQSTFTNRQLFVSYANGTALSYPGAPNFGFTTYPSGSITLAGMIRDYSLSVQMVLTSSNPQTGSVYTATQVVTLTNYSYLFLYSLSQSIAANPAVTDIPNFFGNLSKAYGLLNMAKTAGLYSDQVSAQQALDSLNTMIQNSNNLFG